MALLQKTHSVRISFCLSSNFLLKDVSPACLPTTFRTSSVVRKTFHQVRELWHWKNSGNSHFPVSNFLTTILYTRKYSLTTSYYQMAQWLLGNIHTFSAVNYIFMTWNIPPERPPPPTHWKYAGFGEGKCCFQFSDKESCGASLDPHPTESNSFRALEPIINRTLARKTLFPWDGSPIKAKKYFPQKIMYHL